MEFKYLRKCALAVFSCSLCFGVPYAISAPFLQSTQDSSAVLAAQAQSSQNLSAINSASLLQNPGAMNNFNPSLVGEPGAVIQPNYGSYSQQGRSGVLLPGETHISQLLPLVEADLPPPYGANIFAGGYETERVDGLTENYLVAPGDKLQIWLWGAVNYSNVATVDNQGNIFIPEVGPIKVGDVPAGSVNEFVTAKVKNVYRRNVSVYINLMSATPISVFVTGPIVRPGQYAGMASDSVLYFLKRAGGIDSDRGSYRNIKVIRNGETIQHIDLYDFIREGKLSEISFQDQDVILVGEQGATVNVWGGARNPFRFEFSANTAKGMDLAKYARPLAKVSHVGIVGDRGNEPFYTYLPYEEYLHQTLYDGDRIVFNDDSKPQVYDVQVSGSYLGPSYYTVSKTTRLHDLLNYIEIEEVLADTGSIYILRKSVAEKQKEMIERSLQRLERSVFTAPVSSDSEATIRAKEAEMVMQFAEKARQIDPLGKVIVSENGNVANILLEQGDQIVIPPKTDLVQVGGEVLMPQAVVFSQQAELDDYIAWAGGFTDRADDEKIAVVRANGLVEFDPEAPVKAGDQVLVLPKVDTKVMQAVKDVTQIIYQIAIAANVVLDD